MSVRVWAGAGLAVAVAAVVAVGLRMAGSPGEARLQRLDDRRVQDLRQLKWAVDQYARQQGQLPATLEDAVAARGLSVNLRDPVTEQPYEYRSTAPDKYEVCATFDRASEAPPPMAGDEPFWAHLAGRQCFALLVKPLR